MFKLKTFQSNARTPSNIYKYRIPGAKTHDGKGHEKKNSQLKLFI